jgi:hypothetical protein
MPHFLLNLEEAKAIEDWVMNRVGYISHEFDPIVHTVMRRLTAWIVNKENEKKIKEENSSTSGQRNP